MKGLNGVASTENGDVAVAATQNGNGALTTTQKNGALVVAKNGKKADNGESYFL